MKYELHGMSKSTEYKSFSGAKYRCRHPRNPAWERYGGRGIEFRFTSFSRFLAHLGRKPHPDMSLDRFPDNNGHYEIGNVRWATPFQQTHNSRKRKHYKNWCPKGHSLSGTNVILLKNRNGEKIWRRCRICFYARRAKLRARLRADGRKVY